MAKSENKDHISSRLDLLIKEQQARKKALAEFSNKMDDLQKLEKFWKIKFAELYKIDLDNTPENLLDYLRKLYENHIIFQQQEHAIKLRVYEEFRKNIEEGDNKLVSLIAEYEASGNAGQNEPDLIGVQREFVVSNEGTYPVIMSML